MSSFNWFKNIKKMKKKMKNGRLFKR